MLLPKRTKYRKMQRGRRKGLATRGNDLAFGQFGLQAVEDCYMSNRQIEAARRAMTRYVKRGGQDLDPGLPRQAHHQEARRDPDG